MKSLAPTLLLRTPGLPVRLGLCSVALSLLAAGSAVAQTATWDGGGGSGLWSLNTNWTTDIAPVPTTATTYNLGGNVQNNLDNDLTGVLTPRINFTNNGLGVNTNAFTLAGNTITLNTGSNNIQTTAIASGGSTITDTISAPLVASFASGFRSTFFTTGLGHDLILTGGYSGTGFALSKTGSGTLTLKGTASTHAGTTFVDAGTLKLGASDMLPGNTVELKRGNNNTGLTNPVLDIAGFNDTIGGIIFGHTSTSTTNDLGAPSIIDSTGGGLLTLGGNINYRSGFGGTPTPSGTQSNGTATISANLATGNAARIMDVGDSLAVTEELIISGVISGSGNITKNGAGVVVLSGANTFTGQLLVNAGTVQVAGSTGTLGGTAGVSINGGELLLNGSAADRVPNTAPVNLGGTATTASRLALGSGAVTETFGALTLATGASARVIDFGAPGANGNLTFASLAGDAVTTLQIWNWSGNLAGGGSDQLSIASGSAGSLNLANVSFYSDNGSTLFSSPGATFIGNELVPVPEPGALVFGVMSLAGLFIRRRR